MRDEVVESVEVEMADQLPISSTLELMNVENELVLDKKVEHSKV